MTEIGSRLRERSIAVISDFESRQDGAICVTMTPSSRLDLASPCRFPASDGNLMPNEIAEPEAGEEYGQ
jgi:hypothetical protein